MGDSRIVIPVIVSILILGISASAISVYANDLNPPDYRGAANSLLFKWESITPAVLTPTVFVSGPSIFPLFDLGPIFGLGNVHGFLEGCIPGDRACEVFLPNFVDELDRKFLRFQVSYIDGPAPEDTSLFAFVSDFSQAGCGLLDRQDPFIGYYYEDWECRPNPIIEEYIIITTSGVEITKIVVDTISFSRIDVDIDIKPGSDPNCINEKKKGQTPIAIFGSDSFDVSRIVHSTIRLDGNPGDTIAPTKVTIKDVNSDGFDDLVLKFSNVAMKDAGFFVDNNELFITGNLDSTTGTPFGGSDIINLAGGPNCFD